MLELVTGNLLEADTEALVNTVNTAGHGIIILKFLGCRGQRELLSVPLTHYYPAT